MRDIHFPSGRQLQVLRDVAQFPNSNAVDIRQRLPEIAEGAIYVTLKRLTNHKLVESDKEEASSGPGAPQRWYRVTKRGRMIVQLVLAYETFLESQDDDD